MTRTSVNETKGGRLMNGYDYKNQAWVMRGVYQDCNHPLRGQRTAIGTIWDGCHCYGREHAGEATKEGTK
jgi:hypothetical protein